MLEQYANEIILEWEHQTGSTYMDWYWRMQTLETRLCPNNKFSASLPF